MYDMDNALGSRVSGSHKVIHLGERRIRIRRGLPLNVKIRLDQYDNAIGRLDVEKAGAIADDILEWLFKNMPPAIRDSSV